MRIILGLGNPESRFDGTRHNVGFFVLDQLAREANAVFKPHVKFKADIAEVGTGNDKYLLVKPTTYYNDSGEAARAIADFYKLEASDFLIIHDELALPLGTIRTRVGGSDAGNNGLKSIAAHFGTETHRIRIGVWTEQHHGVDKVQTVLGKFSRNEQTILSDELPTITAIVRTFLDGSFATTTYKIS